MSHDYLADLNHEQLHAVKHGVENGSALDSKPLLVIAGAGSGKTKTLAHRVAHLVVNGIDPHRILLLTFSRRAALDMTNRVKRITAAAMGIGNLDLPWAGTFHAVGARVLREYAQRIGLKPSFTILDRSDAADLMDVVRHDLGLSKKEARFPRKETCLAIYSFAINSGSSLKVTMRDQFPWCSEWETDLRKLFGEYVAAKQRQNVLDYDDLLLAWAEMMNDADLAGELGDRFDHVLVDEYQDTNRLQSKILLKLKPDGHGVTVVGDDAQSIYSFRAATVRNILDFPKEFDPPAYVITLEQNYRSTQPILDACNRVIEFAAERFTKNLQSDRKSRQRPFVTTVADETVQARYVAQQILDSREAGVPLKCQAVLFRASHHSAQLEIELSRRNIPFVKYGGLKFLEAAHVKDVISVFRWAENPTDRVAGFRVLKLLPGIGPTTAAKVQDQVEQQGGNSEVLQSIDVPKPAAEDWPGFASVIARMRKANSPWPAEFGLVWQWYEPHLRRLYDDGHLRAADIAQLEQIAAGYESRERFLTELTLDPPDATSGRARANGLDEDYTILSTIHSAKGQEWRIVRILNVVDGCIPSDMATRTPEEIEEERRLLYVAMTRAKDELDLIIPHRFYVHQQRSLGDRHLYAARSRFIPDTIINAFGCQTWHERIATSNRSAKKESPTIDVAASLRRMWR
jgi:DNA helicase II / ATP-dependent DNA helicase PcrA